MSNGMKISLRTPSGRKAGRGTQSAKGSDRAFRFARIAARVEDVFGDTNTARDWISAPYRALGGVAPQDIMDTDD
jgi:putative toxin-antitoxin system antitoxin component (TIGR02293 family)